MPAIRGRICARAIGHALALACVLLGGGAAGGAVSAQAAAIPADFYGVNSGGELLSNPASRPAAFATMHAIGLTQVRVDASWNGIEPAPPVAGVHTYLWEKTDGFVADLARNGLRWYPMLGYSSPWSTSVTDNLFSPPAGDADFALFTAALAKRYGSAGSFWAEHPELPKLPTTVYGIWNEPSNDTFWRGPEATPARYMRLYLTARAAIKAFDPSARVATAGLLDSGVVDANAYLRAMLDSVPAARAQIDAVGWHPYVGDLDQILTSIRRARTTLTQYGLANVPIEISEVGWHSGFPVSQRAEWLRGLAAKLPHAGLNVTRLMPYVWSGSPEWQITNPDGSLGQLGTAYLAGIRDAVVTQLTGAQATAAQAATTSKKKAAKKKKKAKSTKACKTTKSKTAKKNTKAKAAAAKCVSKAAKKIKRASKSAKRARAASARSRARARRAAALRLRSSAAR